MEGCVKVILQPCMGSFFSSSVPFMARIDASQWLIAQSRVPPTDCGDEQSVCRINEHRWTPGFNHHHCAETRGFLYFQGGFENWWLPLRFAFTLSHLECLRAERASVVTGGRSGNVAMYRTGLWNTRTGLCSSSWQAWFLYFTAAWGVF